MRRWLAVAILVGVLGAPRVGRALDPDTLHVAWTLHPTHELVAQWLSARPDDRKNRLRLPAAWARSVRYRTGDEKWKQAPVQARPFPRSDAALLRAHLRGLTPGSRIELQIGEGSATLHTVTPPNGLSAPLVFVTGGDLGPSQTTAAVAAQLAKRKPRFCLLGGDLAYGNGRDATRWVQLLRILRKELVWPDGTVVPLVVAIGNHEVYGGFGRSRADAPFFFTLFDVLFPRRSYGVIDLGTDVSLLLLDTGHVSSIGGSQRGWIDRTLAARQTAKLRIAAYHVPAYPSHRRHDGLPSAEVRKQWSPVFERRRVSLCFENHDHTYKRTHPLLGGKPAKRGVVYFGDGCWGRQPRTLRNPDAPHFAKTARRSHGYAVTLRPDGRAVVEAIGPDGAVFDRTTVEPWGK